MIRGVRFRERIRETNIKREALLKEFAECLRKVLLKGSSQQQQEHVFPKIDIASQQNLSGHRDSNGRFEVPSTSDTKDDVYGATVSPFLFVLIHNCSIHNTV